MDVACHRLVGGHKAGNDVSLMVDSAFPRIFLLDLKPSHCFKTPAWPCEISLDARIRSVRFPTFRIPSLASLSSPDRNSWQIGVLPTVFRDFLFRVYNRGERGHARTQNSWAAPGRPSASAEIAVLPCDGSVVHVAKFNILLPMPPPSTPWVSDVGGSNSDRYLDRSPSPWRLEFWR